MPDAATPKPVTILNVNDDLTTRYVLSRILHQAGYTVVEAVTGGECLRLLPTHPDMIVLDVSLPDIDGYEVCRRIKSDPETASIPVLHLSANRVSVTDRTEGLESGADGYLTQPVEPAELIATVRALLRLTKAEQSARRAADEWETVFNAIGDGVCLLDSAGGILRCNRAMSSIVGIDRSRIVGCSFGEIIAPISHGKTLAIPTDPHGGRVVEELHAGMRWLRVTVEVVVTPSLSGDLGTAVAAAAVLADITETKEAALRQRAILRDILASVTEGQLRLCFTPHDLPAALNPVGSAIPLSKQNVRALRQSVRALAQRLNFAEERAQDLETAAGEGAMNAVVHARDGVAHVYSDDTDTIQVWLEDHGEGIAIDRLPQATLERGFSSAGTLGHGFYLMLKTADRIYLLTGPSGTTVVLEQDREPITPSWVNRM